MNLGGANLKHVQTPIHRFVRDCVLTGINVVAAYNFRKETTSFIHMVDFLVLDK